MDEILDINRPFQLWTQFQDESPGIFEGFDTLEVALARGCEYSLKPIIYGSVTIKSSQGRILGNFENGQFIERDPLKTGRYGYTPKETGLKTGNLFFSSILTEFNKMNKNDDIFSSPDVTIDIPAGTPLKANGQVIGQVYGSKNSQYVTCVVDSAFHIPKEYRSTIPFDWLEKVGN